MRACTCRSPPPSVIINIVITSERAVLAIASVTVWDFVLGVHDHTHTHVPYRMPMGSASPSPMLETMIGRKVSDNLSSLVSSHMNM